MDDTLAGVMRIVSDGSIAAAVLVAMLWVIRAGRSNDKEQNAVVMRLLDVSQRLSEQNELNREDSRRYFEALSCRHDQTQNLIATHDQSVKTQLEAVLRELEAVKKDVAATAPIASRLEDIAAKLTLLLDRSGGPVAGD